MSENNGNTGLTTSKIVEKETELNNEEVNPPFLKKSDLSNVLESAKFDCPENENANLKSKLLGDSQEEFNSCRRNGGNYSDIHELTSSITPAIQALDRLISLTPSSKQTVKALTALKNEKCDQSINKTNEKKEGSLFKLDMLEHSVLEIELEKLHDLLVKQEKVSQEKISEYESNLTQLKRQTCILQEQIKQAEEKEKVLVKKLNEQNQNQMQLSIVMQEYEKLISKLTAEIETDKKLNNEKLESLTAEKDSALVHLSNVEAAFTDVHQKYEKCKKIIEDYKKNEAKMKNVIGDQVESIKIKEKQLETIQVHASKQLEKIHLEMERSKQIHEQEMTRLRALLRKTELKVISLQESLEQKIKENQELTTICDDLIEGKVPAH